MFTISTGLIVGRRKESRMESFVDYDQFVARLEQVETLYGFKYARQSSTKDFGINSKNNFFIPFIQVR